MMRDPRSQCVIQQARISLASPPTHRDCRLMDNVECFDRLQHRGRYQPYLCGAEGRADRRMSYGQNTKPKARSLPHLSEHLLPSAPEPPDSYAAREFANGQFDTTARRFAANWQPRDRPPIRPANSSSILPNSSSILMVITQKVRRPVRETHKPLPACFHDPWE